jgi:Tol biopolymer transport system component
MERSKEKASRQARDARLPRSIVALTAAVSFALAGCGGSAPGPAPTEPLSSTATLSLSGWFAFTVTGGDLWVMRGDGSDRHQVTTSGDGVDISPTWAPNASRLAFRHSTGAGGGQRDTDTIRIVQADGTGERHLVDGSFPAWSPDGALIAFRGVEGVDLAVIRPDGTGLRSLGARHSECPVWSPDGTRILYCRNEDLSGVVSNNWDVWVMNRDGSGQHQLTNDPARDYPVAWSKDGSRIVFFSDRDGKGASYVMQADGSSVARVTQATDLSSVGVWLPDGRFIIMSADGDTPEWYLVDASGQRRRIPQLSGAFDPIAWVDWP